MTGHDVYLLLPELTVAGLGLLVILLDLVLAPGQKRWLAGVTVLGLVAPLVLTIVLWNDDGAFGPAIFDTLVVDEFALFFKVLILGIVAVVALASVDYVFKFARFQGEYYGLILFSASGMMLLAATRELISIYIALELTALPMAALAAFLRDARSTEAGIKFFLLSAMSSAVLLYGLALVYGLTGSTHLPVIFAQIAQPAGDTPFGSPALLLGVILVVAGFGFKISSVPFQMWVPDVYEGSPTPVVAFLSVGSKAAGFAIILRVFYQAFGGVAVEWWVIFAVLGAVSMTVGNLVAMAQSNIKRLLGYSTIAHAGYIMVGLAAIAARTPDGEGALGPGALLFYLGAYAVTNLTAFVVVIAVSNRIGSDMIDDFAGMGRRAPWLAALLAFSLISLIGLPPTAGFMGKLFLFNAAIQADLVWLALLGVVNSVVSAYYYVRVMRVMYLQPSPSEERVPSSAPFRLALAVSGVGILVLGIIPGPLLEVAQNAATTILP